jgi:hypothetical protein
MPNAPLPCSITLPLKAVADRRHLPAMGLFLTAIFCESLMYPLLILSSFALFGKVISSGWFSSAITALAAVSLALTHYVRIPNRRWQLFGFCLIGIGLGFLAFDLSFTLQTLLFAGACFAILRVNYQAVWFALATRAVEREWGHFGKNQALVLSEIFVFAARIGTAVLLLICGGLTLSFTQSLWVMTGLYLVSATTSVCIARFLDRRAALTPSKPPLSPPP